MKYSFTVFTLLFTCLGSCNTGTHQDASKASKADSVGTMDTMQAHYKRAGKCYQFDTNSFVDGCAKEVLQKKSLDKQYELVVECRFDDMPLLKYVQWDSTTKGIEAYLRKYPANNDYISRICSDTDPLWEDREIKPVVFTAVSGRLMVTKTVKIDGVGSISVVVRDLIVKDSSNNILFLPEEEFNDVKIGWWAG
ncbi:hypothetical protein SAMN05421788_113118 [Filimonas lacunae]|uniref:Uncharacterized protein n=1 Tax=Filimonas lacunae TaxID=477680 RepID=A0A1N7RF71_9BACT|nr:hypothetical protein [Filimonas lacunae]SIT33780.1 hypothetical protein SAMN05421788_113118 [Filimonas lacunae]